MRVQWERGDRKVIGNKDAKRGFVPRNGKNGGPVIEQKVTKILAPKGAA